MGKRKALGSIPSSKKKEKKKKTNKKLDGFSNQGAAKKREYVGFVKREEQK